ncbi:hypothetical protein BKA63DRAFT_573089 [Paraphoma chrysanthemicola]|nr:hypothetical protein BKA63DRAFT_573089 [Paraphoma chrysanthemicola]
MAGPNKIGEHNVLDCGPVGKMFEDTKQKLRKQAVMEALAIATPLPSTPPQSRECPSPIEAQPQENQDRPADIWVSSEDCLRLVQDSELDCLVTQGNNFTTRPYRATLRLVPDGSHGPTLYVEHHSTGPPATQPQESPMPITIELRSVFVGLEKRRWRRDGPKVQQRIIRFKPHMKSSIDTDICVTCAKTPELLESLGTWYRALAFASRHR